MALEIKPPTPLPADPAYPTLFLAGTIEMGKAAQWQNEIATLLDGEPVILLNPRRDDWDSSWDQSINDPRFVEQVEWELSAQEMADWILFYFEPNSQSPITLLELGLAARHKPACVCCPPGFWRKGNVDVVCRRYAISVAGDLNELAQWVRAQLSKTGGQ